MAFQGKGLEHFETFFPYIKDLLQWQHVRLVLNSIVGKKICETAQTKLKHGQHEIVLVYDQSYVTLGFRQILLWNSPISLPTQTYVEAQAN